MNEEAVIARLRTDPALDRPVLVFDGNCGFCRFWIDRWQRMTGDVIYYVPYQSAAGFFPAIPPQAFEEAVQLIEPDGSITSGADAVFELLASAGHPWRWLVPLRELPAMRALARNAYKFIARNRSFFSLLTRMAFGRGTAPTRYLVARWIFTRSLGVIYAIAFVSLAFQLRGLIGRHGVLPAGEFLAAARDQLSEPGRYFRLPTLFWFGSSDAALLAVCWAGAFVALLAAAGVVPSVCLFVCWLFYLSLTTVSQRFLSYQWDVLLLEAGFLGIFLALSQGARETRAARVSRWLLLWLLFRLTFESGAVKLASGDRNWRELTALRYHYETQPLPAWTSWYAHWASPRFHKFSALMIFAIELVAPFLIFGPRNFRRAAFGAMASLQAAIALTGNYGYFNYLTIALSLLLLDDQAWPARWRKRMQSLSDTPPPRWFPWALAPVASMHFLLGASQLKSSVNPAGEWPGAVAKVQRWIDPFRLVNGYGLFAVMTTRRPEIVIEGSRDAIAWQPYEFPWKPGDLQRRPRFVAPYQPRLDWQMWFAALGRYEQNLWVLRLMQRIYEQRPEVLALLKTNPFPNDPPRYLQAVLYQYEFSQPGSGGDWWTRKNLGLYAPVLEVPPALNEDDNGGR